MEDLDECVMDNIRKWCKSSLVTGKSCPMNIFFMEVVNCGND